MQSVQKEKEINYSCKGCFNTRVLSTWFDDYNYFIGTAKAIRCEFNEFKLCLYFLL